MNLPPSPSYGPPPADLGQPPVDYGPAQPFAVPPRDGYGRHVNTIHNILIVSLVVILAAALVGTVIILVNRHSSASSTAPVRAPAVEAIDIASQPSLGTPLNVTDGDPYKESLDEQFFITPCGMFVSILTSGYRYVGSGSRARIVGYDLTTGAKAWTVPLQEATGLNDPILVTARDVVTYSSACTMVMTLASRGVGGPVVGLAVDLSTGEATAFASDEEIRGCAVTESDRIACLYFDKITIFDVAQGTSDIRDLGIDALAYLFAGDWIVDGMVWSEDGYRDPVSGDVVFGSDVFASYLSPDQDWVMYEEPQTPGGYLSGLAVRVEGPLGTGSTGTCSIMVWDTAKDKGTWHKPGSIPCGHESSYLEWTVAGSALIVYNELDDVVWAFSLAEGSLLWEKNSRLKVTPWYSANDYFTTPGLTDDYAIFRDDTYRQVVTRIEDGETTPVDCPGGWTPMTVSSTMVYANGNTKDGQTLAAFALTSAETDPLWTLTLPKNADTSGLWTFATDGTMYVVYREREGPTFLAALNT